METGTQRGTSRFLLQKLIGKANFPRYCVSFQKLILTVQAVRLALIFSSSLSGEKLSIPYLKNSFYQNIGLYFRL